MTNYRGLDRLSPRDNILLELGMFLASLGKHRTAILHVKDKNKKIASLPSDLEGLTTLRIDEQKTSQIEYVLSNWLIEVRSYIDTKNPDADEIISLIRNKIGNISHSWQSDVNKYVLDSFRRSIELLHVGEIILSPTEYYYSLYSEVDTANDSTEIIAVATLSSSIWTNDPEQDMYIDKNLNAKKRGVDIRRLFIVSDSDWFEISESIKKQINAGIEIRRASPKLLGELQELEDMAIFVDKKSGIAKGYVADLGFNKEKRIRKGRLILDAHNRKALIDEFYKAWKISIPVDIRTVKKAKGSTFRNTDCSPCDRLKKYKLSPAVVTCKEAAKAKGIPLCQELKTLILNTSTGLVALHLPGDSKGALRAVKNALEVDEAHMVSGKVLASLGLEDGTVSAVCSPVWEMPHLISRRVLSFDFVSTNTGNKKEFFNFSPSILMDAESVMLGDFEA